MPYDTRYRFEETTREHARRLGQAQRWTKIRRRALLLKLDGLTPAEVQERAGITNCPNDIAKMTVDEMFAVLQVTHGQTSLIPSGGAPLQHAVATVQHSTPKTGPDSAEKSVKDSNKLALAQAGVMIGHPPHGYKMIGSQFVIVDGQQQIVALVVIDEKERSVTLFLFEQYLEGKTFHDIAKALNTRGDRTRKGKEWDHETLRDMLRNPTYAGYILYRGVEHRNQRDAGQLFPGLHPAIVSWETFCRAQDIRVQRDPRNPQSAWTCPWTTVPRSQEKHE